ncbi:MAG: hypothetical protein IJX39_03790 [Clostridia bacterium]|nr:hypothetical protein [Clostridia bacterium]
MFRQAKPVWLQDLENEKNLFVAFTAKTGSLKGTELHLSAAMFYRLFVNGKFAAFGPARTAKGYARVDILPLEAFDNGGENALRIEVAGYHCRSLSTCLQSSFLCAELRRGTDVIAFTGRDFTGAVMTEKEQRAERYSIQRHFGEIWDFTKGADASAAPTVVTDAAPVWLARVAPYPHYEDILLQKISCRGTFAYNGELPCKEQKYSWKTVPEYWGRFEESEIPYKPCRWIQQQEQHITQKGGSLPLTLRAGEYALLDFSRIECGFLQLTAETVGRTDLVIGYSEYCENDTFSFTRINCHNVIEYLLPAGEHALQSFEPYTMRFAIVMVKEGALTLSSFGVKTFERDMTGARIPTFEDPVHESIYRAALRTFAHNAVDLYSDCPSRERAGWLCDSYFTGTAEYHFFGKVPVEDAFLENYRHCNDPRLPEGMLAMCYPSDIKIEDNGMGYHIPQWCMWYVLEVEEYLTRRNQAVDPALFRPTVEGILRYFAKFENSDGLLEDLPSWNFVEWSDANSWTQNVNYPTNFLYAAVLLAAHRLYGNEEWEKKARHIRAKTAELSFDGELFTDNAERDGDGVLHNTGNTSEAGQYYAILFGDIDPDAPQYAALRRHVLTGFKGVAESGRRFVPVNAFIGLYLRLKTLLKLELYQLILDEVGDFFGGMAEKTGTLWEYRQMKGSFDHGFASYAAYAMCVALEHI